MKKKVQAQQGRITAHEKKFEHGRECAQKNLGHSRIINAPQKNWCTAG